MTVSCLKAKAKTAAMAHIGHSVSIVMFMMRPSTEGSAIGASCCAARHAAIHSVINASLRAAVLLFAGELDQPQGMVKNPG
jgi:hypothetical protein